MKGQGLSEQELFDYGANLVRNQMATRAGRGNSLALRREAAPSLRKRGYPGAAGEGLSPVDVINAISSQNLALPSGTVKIGPTEYNVEMNGSTRYHRRAQ